MKNLRQLVLLILACFCISSAFTQDETLDVIQQAQKIKSTLKADPFSYNGNLLLDFRSNYISGLDRRADPFDFRASGNISITTFGFRSALSLNFSDGRVVRRLTRPNIKLPGYRFIGLSPSYKWAKLHLGYRNMSLSPYTMSGNSFYGVGAELTPGKFRFSGFYGRLQRATPEQLNISNSLDPAYKRFGWGIKTGYDSGVDNIYLILFGAKDDPNSISLPEENPLVRPTENMIISTQGKKHISDIINVTFDYAWSGFTRNTLVPDIDNNAEYSWINRFGGLFQPKLSTGFHKALKTSLNVNLGGAALDIMHERVDPGYQSLGALFFNNDYENITAGVRKSILKKKINANLRLGLQRNNLKNTENNTLRRIVGQANINYQVNQALNIQANYSNFSSTNILRLSQLPIVTEDSLLLTQVTTNINLTASYVTGKQKQSIFSWVNGFQKFNTIENEIINQNQSVNNLISQFNHLYRFSQKSAELGNGIMVNVNQTSAGNFISIVPNHSFGKKIIEKKLDAKIIISNAFYLFNNEFQRHIVIGRLHSAYKINKMHDITLSGSYAFQTVARNVQSLSNFNEITLFLKYGLKF